MRFLRDVLVATLARIIAELVKRLFNLFTLETFQLAAN